MEKAFAQAIARIVEQTKEKDSPLSRNQRRQLRKSHIHARNVRHPAQEVPCSPRSVRSHSGSSNYTAVCAAAPAVSRSRTVNVTV